MQRLTPRPSLSTNNTNVASSPDRRREAPINEIWLQSLQDDNRPSTSRGEQNLSANIPLRVLSEEDLAPLDDLGGDAERPREDDSSSMSRPEFSRTLENSWLSNMDSFQKERMK